MNEQARVFIVFALNTMLAGVGVLLLVLAFIISSHMSTEAYLAVSALKILSMVMIGYGSTRAWLIFRRELKKSSQNRK